MTEEIINSDGSRNWEANILLDNIKRLEQENKELKNEINKLGKKHEDYCNTMYWQMKEQMDKYRSALEEIKELLNLGICKNGVNGNCRPIRNTKKEDCYNAIYKVKDIIREVLS